MILGLGISLGLTLLFEGVFGWVWGLRRRDLYLLFLVNLLTNPVVVFTNAITGAVLLPEVWAVVTEGWLYARLSDHIQKPWAFAIAVNVFSYCSGVLLSAIL